MSSKNYSLSRVNRDIKEISKTPIKGIGIISLDNNPYKYIVNIRIMEGIYEGYCLQLLLSILENYPISPPKILIYPGQPFDNNYHHHIFEDNSTDENGGHFKKFCFDLLKNDFLSTEEQFTGWNPSYTISTLLLQIQNFLSIPDLPENHLPNQNKIEELMKSMDNYKRIFVIKEDDKEIIKIHTWKNPYPKIFLEDIEDSKKNIENIEIKDNSKNENEKMKIIKEYLTCYVSRLNYIDNKNLLLGCPIKGHSYLSLIPLPEIISYDSYMMRLFNKNEDNSLNNYQILFFNNRRRVFFNQLFINNNDFNLNNKNIIYNNNIFKSANNEFYNNWLPLYINEEHYLNNKTTILNSFSIVKYGNLGLKEYDFKPEIIFEILPNMLYEMLSKIVNEKSLISSSFIICFFQYFLLYKKLFENFKRAYRKYINNYLDNIIKHFFDLELKDLNKLDDYFIEGHIDFGLLTVKKTPTIIALLLLCFFSNTDPNSREMKKIAEYLSLFKNTLYLYLFYIDKIIMTNSELFLDDLFKYDLFYKIVDLISSDKYFLKTFGLKGGKTTRRKVIKNMMTNFKKAYKNCNKMLKNKLDKLLITKMDISKYFDIKTIVENENVLLDNKYDIFIIYNIFEKKTKEKNFMKVLEDNYGIYLDVDDFMKEINDQINSIKFFSDFNKFHKKTDNNDLFEINILYKFGKTDISKKIKSLENNIYEHKRRYFWNFQYYSIKNLKKNLSSQKEQKKEIKHINRLKRELEDQMKKRKNEEETLYFNRIHKKKPK